MMTTPKRKRSSSSDTEELKPNVQAFLSTLSALEAKAWREEIVETDGYSSLINRRHLTNLTIDQLELLTSTGSCDGEKISYVY
jgi:hypothetical protein